jgi:acid phosphatase family membrane protein YuiD
MSQSLIEALVAILTAVVGLAALAVLVSKNANTTGVLSAGGSAFSSMLSAATAPVTGGGTMPASNYGIGNSWMTQPGF